MRLLRPALATALVAPLLALTAATTPADEATAAPRKAPRYEARITRTEHGIPHITADSWGDLGFGSGYAAAQTTPCNLLDTLVTAKAARSYYFGPEETYDDEVTLDATNLQVDAFVTDLRNRRVVEKLLRDRTRGPGRQARQMVEGYTAGANRYLARMRGRVSDPACAGSPALRMRVRPIDVWYGLYLANLLASAGVFLPQIVEADPPSLDDPGLPEIPTASSVDRDALLRGLGKDPDAPFGSNATAVGGDESTTGRGMILGNPHFPWRGRYRFSQQHLTIPGKYDVAGGSLIGSPVVNIGWNKDVAWSHTVSTAYRFTPYEFPTVGPNTIVTESGPQELERREVRVRVRRADGSTGVVTEDLYRTPVGYVLDAPDVFMPWSAASVWAMRDANGEQLRTIDTFLNMGKARSVRDLLARQDKAGGMPWVNTTAADRRGRVLYADHSVVPHVTDEKAQECMTPVGRLLFQVAGLPGLDGTRAQSSCAWGSDPDASRPGILGPGNLPDVVRRDWVGNANDSYWTPSATVRLEGYDRIIGCEECERTPRTRMVYRYLTDRLKGRRKESPRSLASHQHANRTYAGILLRADDDLADVCEQTSDTAACEAIAKWDGRSERSSRAYHVIEEFVPRLPATAWVVPFDPADPMNTPRDLNERDPQVVQALRDAIAAVRERGIALDARWGRLQVAGDRGAPRIPLGGGTGDALGNANALASRKPQQNASAYRPVTYGSSHIQAIAFTGRKRVVTRTILTYGQSDDPTSPWSSDQTRLFSRERWVRFPWTDRQIRRQRIGSVVVRGR